MGKNAIRVDERICFLITSEGMWLYDSIKDQQDRVNCYAFIPRPTEDKRQNRFKECK